MVLRIKWINFIGDIGDPLEDLDVALEFVSTVENPFKSFFST